MVDLIDRQAVQEMVDRIGDIHPYRQIGNRESYSQYNEAWTDAINRVDAELNSLPSADIDLSGFSDKLWAAAYERGKAEAVRWIPWDSGKLPEESGTYTVTAHDGATKRVTYAKYQKRLKRWELTGARAYWRVLAWMPLPEPYKDGEQDG